MKLRSNIIYDERKQKVLRKIFVKNRNTKSTEPEARVEGEISKNKNRSGEKRTKKTSTTAARKQS